MHFLIFGPGTDFWMGQEVNRVGQKFCGLKTSVAVGSYSIQYEGICWSSLAKKVEQMDEWMDRQTKYNSAEVENNSFIDIFWKTLKIFRSFIF